MIVAPSGDGLACASHLRTRRRTVLVAFGLALLVLALAISVFVSARLQDRQAGVVLEQSQQSLQQARHRQALAEQQTRLHDTLGQLAAHARTYGLAPEQWSERRVGLRQQSIGRAAADDILTTTGRGNGHLFAVQAFDLSVTRADEGLFELPALADQPLRMTMGGTAYFSTRGDQ
jgi:hypothetical protein